MPRLIDADALWEQMKELHQKRCEESDMTGDRAVCVTWHDAVVCIKDAPTIDAVKVRHGYWLATLDGKVCSNCGSIERVCRRFCPQCGCDMRTGI